MKIRCGNSDFSNAISIAMRAVPSKTTTPILECVLIEADDGGTITITSNSMEMGIVTMFDGVIDEPGSIAIEAKTLNDIAKKLPACEVTISADASLVAKIKSGKSKFEIPCREASEFPELPEVDKGVAADVTQADFKNAVLKSIFCTDPDNSNVMMTGEKIELDGDTLRLTAIDGHRVAMVNVQLDNDYGKFETVIPGKTLMEVSRMLKDGWFKIEVTQNHAIFTFDNTTLVSRVIYGKYFDISKILNVEPVIRVKTSSDDLASCINRASVVIRESDKRPIVMNITDGIVQLVAKTQFGNASEEISVEKEGPDLTIGFNARFLIDAVNAAAFYSDQIDIGFGNAKSPAIISDADSCFKYMVLPVNMA